MRICSGCNAAPLEKYAKLCSTCRKICQKCKKNENRPGQRTCWDCHALRMRRTRPRYRDLTVEQKKVERAKSLARYYLKTGLIERKPCAVEGCERPAEMHQPNPVLPLRIVWACKRHWRRMRHDFSDNS